MSFDRSQARCSFCGRHTSDVRRMVAGPGAAYICDECLQLCNDILQDPTPFSTRALELASRPPVVIAAPVPLTQEQREKPDTSEPVKTIPLQLEQKHNGMILILHQLQYYQSFFDLLYMWIRPPLQPGLLVRPTYYLLPQRYHRKTMDRRSRRHHAGTA